MIRDRNIDWRRKRFFINAMDFTGTIGGTNKLGLGAGAPVASEITALNLGAMNIGAADDEFIHYMAVPYDADPESELGFRIGWTSGSTTDADDMTWTLLCDFKAEDASFVAPVTAISSADAVLDDVVGATAALHNSFSPRAVRNAGWLTRAQVEVGTAMMMFEIKNIVNDPTTPWCTGVLIDYKLRATHDGESHSNNTD